MSKTLNWAIRDKIHLMKEHDRFTALVYLVLRSNLHFRAWPSNELTTTEVDENFTCIECGAPVEEDGTTCDACYNN